MRRVLLVGCLWAALIGCGEEGTNENNSSNAPPGTDTQGTGSDLNTPPSPSDTNDSGDAGPVYCTPGEQRCEDKSTAKTCNEDGDGWDLSPCTAGTVCAGGACKLLTCTPGEALGTCLSEQAMEVCDITGTSVEYEYCDVATPVCLGGVCQDLHCAPGSTQCKGVSAIETCNADGSAYEVTTLCGEGGLCKNAKCLTACELNVKQNTYIGCEYWVADLDNIEAGQFQAIAAVVSNPSLDTAVEVTIHNLADGVDIPLDNPLVAPSSQETYLIPKGYDVDGTTLSPNTFRIRASGPVTVHQFNPLNAAGVFSNDASLLLPANSAGKEFFAMSWPQRQADDFTNHIPLHGFVSIIALEKGETTVTVYPTSLVEHSDLLEPLTPYAPNQIILQYGEILNLETGGGQSGPDLTGTRILSDRRVTVFSGHECANIPLNIVKGTFKGADFCDHIEQQLFPLDTWGTQYVADRFSPRSEAQTDVWRILAGANQTVIQTDPPQPGADGTTLDKGQYIEFESGDSFFISATGPISVGHYLKSSNYEGFTPDPECDQAQGATGIGDPAFSIAVGTIQFRADYIVLTPENYRQHYLNFMYKSGTTVELDGAPVELAGTPLGLTNWNVHTMEVIPGVHHISASQPVGVTAYGYDCDVSYAYPGGLNLEAQ